MQEFIKAIPAAASSPYAFMAYAISAILFLFAGARLRMAKLLMARLESVPQAERRRVLEIAAGQVLPEKISPRQWVRLKRTQWTFVLVGSILIAAIAVATIALLNRNVDAAELRELRNSAAEEASRTRSKINEVGEGVAEQIEQSAAATKAKVEETEAGLRQKIGESTETIVVAVEDTALANLEAVFPLAVRIDRNVDGTIVKLRGDRRQRLVSYDRDYEPLVLYWGDRFHYFVFGEGAERRRFDSGGVFLEVSNSARTSRLPLALDPYEEHEIRIPGSSPAPMEAYIVNEPGIRGVELKITVYSADRERGREQFREALMATSLSSAARRTYLEVTQNGLRLRSSGSGTAAVLRTLQEGTYVRVKERSEGWCMVRLPEGREGWVSCQYLREIE